ncbi:hypothetical protein MAR_003051 [Mya arenaria]|uniref:Secreted protein n=1 Tax=Mya arenaria TaxID=6604 RepID=A0ABY7G8H1_MYAAR|nr:hypothetical protein MAR_003051 [Mya arenaria]
MSSPILVVANILPSFLLAPSQRTPSDPRLTAFLSVQIDEFKYLIQLKFVGHVRFLAWMHTNSKRKLCSEQRHHL